MENSCVMSEEIMFPKMQCFMDGQQMIFHLSWRISDITSVLPKLTIIRSLKLDPWFWTIEITARPIRQFLSSLMALSPTRFSIHTRITIIISNSRKIWHSMPKLHLFTPTTVYGWPSRINTCGVIEQRTNSLRVLTRPVRRYLLRW